MQQGAHAVFQLGKPSFKKEILFLLLVIICVPNSRQLICWCFDSDILLKFTKLVKFIPNISYITVFLKIRNTIFKNRRSKIYRLFSFNTY